MNTSDYITIPLTKGQETIIDAIDADLADLKWYAMELPNDRYYATRNLTGKPRRIKMMHVLILERLINRLLNKGECSDHVNGNSLDNRRSNLRLATNSENASNVKRHRDNKSGYKGVVYDSSRKKWRAEIMSKGERRHLGRYDTAEEAYRAYCQEAVKLHGKFARFE